MSRNTVTTIKLIIIVLAVVVGGYKLYTTSKQDYPPAGTKTRTAPFHNGSATMPADK
jgi:hypothetical protein